MENVKNRIDLRLATNDENVKKLQTKLQFKDSKVIDGLHLIELYRKQVVYDKPIDVGTSILDISKICMMDFHYNVIHKNFEGRYHLIYSDTDSMIYIIQHEDIYEWIKNNPEHFDLSDSIRSDLKDDTNKKKPGKFKDELNSLVMTEALALNPKIYSFNHQTKIEFDEFEVKNKKVLKGVSKVVVKNEIEHKDYVSVLETDEAIKRDVTSIRSFNHQLYTYKQNKVALTSHYDKMIMLNRNECVPCGYNHPQKLIACC